MEQNITAVIFVEGLDAEKCLPTEYSGYASVAAADAAAAAVLLLLLGEAIDSLPTKNFVELRSNDVGTTAVVMVICGSNG